MRYWLKGSAALKGAAKRDLIGILEVSTYRQS
jgi:hypothetical protein